MQIKINKDGNLFIKRGYQNEFKEQFCPFDPDPRGCNCGDWCPLFQIEEVYGPGNMSCTDERLVCTELQLCHNKKIEVDDIEYESI